MLNHCEFIGNLGADPEARSLANGDKVVNLRLAVTDKWKDKASGEWRERTEWIPIAIFNQMLAEKAQSRLKKGSKIFVSGSWSTRKWTDNSGAERQTTEVVINAFNGKLIPLDTHKQEDSERQASTQQSKPAQKFPGRQSHDLDDEIPF
jgi:single-strand DNA-binding protein